MIASALFHLLACSLLSLALCLLGAILTLILQDRVIALELIKSWVFEFNGIIVGALGYGLMFFVMRRGRAILIQIRNLVEIPDDLKYQMIQHQVRATSWRWAALVSGPITLVGGAVMWFCEFPLQGFSKYYLATCSISIYFVATVILSFFMFTLAMFNALESASDAGTSIRLLQSTTKTRFLLETVDSFFIVTSTIGIFAIYAGFRGTLTANFMDIPEIIQDLLVLPLILYLPATLTYSLYPRYVLRKLSERDTIERIEEVVGQLDPPQDNDFQSSLELRKLIMEVRELWMQEHRSPPVLGLKDAPSLTMALLIVVQFIWKSDTVVSEFFKGFF